MSDGKKKRINEARKWIKLSIKEQEKEVDECRRFGIRIYYGKEIYSNFIKEQRELIKVIQNE